MNKKCDWPAKRDEERKELIYSIHYVQDIENEIGKVTENESQVQ